MLAYVLTVAVVDALLTAAGFIGAGQMDVPLSSATPIILAFLFQAAWFLLPGFPAARATVARAFEPKQLAMLLTAAGVAPYLIYSVPLGVFSLDRFVVLLAIAATAPLLFVAFPAEGRRLTWQDLLAMAVLVTPVISGPSEIFRYIFVSPPDVGERLDVLGKLMAFSVGSMAFLCLRKVEGAGFCWAPNRKDLSVGFKHFLYYLPIGIPLCLVMGVFDWPQGFALSSEWAATALVTGLGVYLAVAMGEELCFRGILQNLLETTLSSPWKAQAISAVAFGAVHLSFRGFPNWEFAAAAAVAGWFYGRAYRSSRSTTAAAVAHTLVVVVWRTIFEG